MLEYLDEKDVPETLKDVVDAIGMDSFKALVKLTGGGTLYIPSEACITRPVRNRIIKESFKGSYRELSMMYGMSENQIRNIVAGK